MASLIREVGVPLLAAVIGAAGVVAAANMGLIGTNREMDVKMVEIAVGILSQEPTDNIAPAREWAVDVISHFAGPVKPSAAAKQALVTYKAIWGYGVYDYSPYDVMKPSRPLTPEAPN